jgi:DNA-directed RNA polymerase subunit RPC12/RpoP
MPLDDDGFLRRECPNCEREFKWRPTPEGEVGEPAPEAGYACPYCAKRAPSDHWWTKDQLEHAESLAVSEILGPELKALERRADPDALISFEVSVDTPPRPAPLPDEPNDMQRVDFDCHPAEPVKVADDWSEALHCLICASTAA